MSRLTDVMTEIEGFLTKIQADGYEPTPVEENGDFRAFEADELQAIEGAGGAKIPAELRAFWSRGLKSPLGSNSAPFISVGLEFNPARNLLRDMPMHRQLADDQSEAWAKKLHQTSYLLTADSPPYVVSEAGAVHVMVYDGDSPEQPLASSLSEFLETWLALGCFNAGNFKEHWARVKAHVPRRLENGVDMDSFAEPFDNTTFDQVAVALRDAAN